MTAVTLKTAPELPGYSAVPGSVHVLAELGAREAGAIGYALFRHDGSGRPIRSGGAGASITTEDIEGKDTAAHSGRGIASFHLLPADDEPAVLAFSFENRAAVPETRPRLDRLVSAIEQLWRLSSETARLAAHAARVGQLEIELADSKIANRARGYLEESGASDPSGDDAIGAMAQHVQTVIRHFESSAFLRKRREQLEQEAEERVLTSKAKTFLRQTVGLSEDAAHRHLRMLSRSTRRPIREIALSLLSSGTQNRRAR